MRTTLTLDDDVAAKLSARARKTGRPFKQVVNDAIRAGLSAQNKARELPPFAIGKDDLFRVKPGVSYDKTDELFDELDGAKRLR